MATRFVALLAALLSVAAPAAAVMERDPEQEEAYEAARSGAIRPLGDIIAKAKREVGGTFLGSDFDAGSRTYHLKFMRDGAVVVVDVDARTGDVLGTSEN